jgi:NADH-quinone oxidoreductase subunit F
MTVTEPVLLPHTPVRSVAEHVERGGGRALTRARGLGPERVIDEVAASGLRGRGGAGFPTGRKWRSVRGDGPGDGAGDRYVVCNGAEGEPGTFKDRAILRADPYQVVEGVAVAALAVGASEAYIAVKRSFEPEIEALSRALVEMAEADLVGDVPITLVAGPEEYLFGEETGLLQVVEGDAPLPRLFPPYLQGLYATTPNSGWSARAGLSSPDGPPLSFDAANPTLVNNVETLATAGHVIARGADWHRSMGTDQSPGLTVCTVVGDVARAGVAEIELGTPLRQVIEQIGGGPAEPGRDIKAVLSGVSNPVILPDHLDAPLSYEGLQAVGSGMGSCGFIVYDDRTSMVELAHAVSRFLYVESCGQCPACKLGTGEITTQLDALLARELEPDALDVVTARLRSVTDGNRCYLPVQEQQVIASLMRAFPSEFEQAAAGLRPRMRGITMPKLVDVADGEAVLDERQPRKNPDWTYD